MSSTNSSELEYRRFAAENLTEPSNPLLPNNERFGCTHREGEDIGDCPNHPLNTRQLCRSQTENENRATQPLQTVFPALVPPLLYNSLPLPAPGRRQDPVVVHTSGLGQALRPQQNALPPQTQPCQPLRPSPPHVARQVSTQQASRTAQENFESSTPLLPAITMPRTNEGTDANLPAQRTEITLARAPFPAPDTVSRLGSSHNMRVFRPVQPLFPAEPLEIRPVNPFAENTGQPRSPFVYQVGQTRAIEGNTTQPIPRIPAQRRISRGRQRGGVRGFSRRRGRRAVVGASAVSQEDPTTGWKIPPPVKDSILSEPHYVNLYLTHRIRLFVKAATERLKLELEVKSLNRGRCGVMILMVDEVLQTCRSWLNEFIVLKEVQGIEITASDMYRYLGVLLFSHYSGFSMKKVIHLLNVDRDTKLNERILFFIHNNVLAYPPTGRGGDSSFTWNAQRDQTVHLVEFERKAFRLSSKVFLSPNHTFCTLDDDLMGTRSKDSQVKTISARKADKEGHSSTIVSDAFFRVVLHLRFNRRGEKRTEAVGKTLAALLENRGEQCLQGIVLTLDRGFSSEEMVRSLLTSGVACVTVMKSLSLKCHPFVGKSFLKPGRIDDSDSDTDYNNPDASILPRPRVLADRPERFIIEDSPRAGMACYRALKTLNPRSNSSQRITALAVRVHGTTKQANIVRFMHAVPSPVDESFQHWTATHHTWKLDDYLYSNKRDDGRIELPAGNAREDLYIDMKDELAAMIMEDTHIMSAAQRCADWFVMREFRLTSTAASHVLLGIKNFREAMGYPVSPPASGNANDTPVDIFMKLSKGWFSLSRSTEPMMRGTMNEGAVLASFEKQPYICSVYQAGLLANKKRPWLGTSPDALAVFDNRKVPEMGSRSPSPPVAEDDQNSWRIAVLEIKTSVSSSSLGRASRLATPDLVLKDIRDPSLRDYVPDEHCAQLIHHSVVANIPYCFYIAASESQILYTVLTRVPSFLYHFVVNLYDEKIAPILKWAHESPSESPLITGDEELDKAVSTRLAFWSLLNSEILMHVPFVPVRVFKHSCQTLYNKTKGGVDGSTQMRAIMRCSTDTPRWEQKIMTHVLKSISVNSWIGWKIFAERGSPVL